MEKNPNVTNPWYKALTKRSRKSTQVRKSELANTVAMSGQMDSQVDASSVQVARKPFQCSLAHAPYKGKQYWDQLATTCVGWPNGEKLAFTCVQIWAPSKWTQVIASLRKYTQVMAKQSHKLTQVFNLRLLATPFGQGLTDTFSQSIGSSLNQGSTV